MVNSDFFRLAAQLVNTTFSQNGYSSRTTDDQETARRVSPARPIGSPPEIMPPLPSFPRGDASAKEMVERAVEGHKRGC